MTGLSKAYVDGFLVEWDANEYAARVLLFAQRSRALKTSLTGTEGGTAKRAQTVREKLLRTVRRAPEVMIKITSSCRGLRQIVRHIDYISRKGELDLEDQDGFILRGRDELGDLKGDWQTSGVEPIPIRSERRDTLNIILSMPAFTDEVGMKRAARAFAAKTFDGHQYVFAYHTQATDPDPSPPAHPHVHICVKVQGRDGRRLNPRKADLKKWRDGFARELRAQGIEANATHRLARLQRQRGPSRMEIARAERHGSNPREPLSRGDVGRSELGRRRVDYYNLVKEVLAKSSLSADRRLAKELGKFLQDLAIGRDTQVRDEPGQSDHDLGR